MRKSAEDAKAEALARTVELRALRESGLDVEQAVTLVARWRSTPVVIVLVDPEASVDATRNGAWQQCAWQLPSI